MDGQQIKQLRKGLGLSQEGLARKLGMSYNSVYLWERGSHRPSPLALEKLKLIEAELAEEVGSGTRE